MGDKDDKRKKPQRPTPPAQGAGTVNIPPKFPGIFPGTDPRVPARATRPGVAHPPQDIGQLMALLGELARDIGADVPVDPAMAAEFHKLGLDWQPRRERVPADPVFKNAQDGLGGRGVPSSAERIEQIKAHLKDFENQYKQEGGRADRFYPYLLIRSFGGDRGDRPIFSSRPWAFPLHWSPDIWIQPGEPSTNPDLPPAEPPTPPAIDWPEHQLWPFAHGFQFPIDFGKPYTLYAHVWNLGRAPLVGARVEFFYIPVGLEVWSAEAVGRVGIARVDLPPRSSEHCHRLVKCPQALVVPRSERDRYNILVRVSCVGDEVTDTLHPDLDRHVAMHLLEVNA